MAAVPVLIAPTGIGHAAALSPAGALSATPWIGVVDALE